MTEGTPIEPLHSPPHTKVLLSYNVSFQDGPAVGPAQPCNGLVKHSPATNSEQVIEVRKPDSNENMAILMNRSSEQSIVSPSSKEEVAAVVLSLRQGGDLGLVNCVQDENPHLEDRERAYRQGNWVFSEILILLEAKLREQTIYGGDSKRSCASADDKWKQVADYCRSKGVQRTKEQCRIKWDNMMPDFRKIRDYEEQKEAGAQSYFDMTTWERRSKLLPSNMDAEVYQKVANILSNKPSKGGLKREAREKRLLDQSAVMSPALGAGRAEGSNGADLDRDGLRVSGFVSKHVVASAPRKRRRRKMVETALPEFKAKPDTKIELETPHDDSSTEDDTTVMSARSQQGAPVLPCFYAERSGFPSQYAERSALPPHQRMRFESREMLPASFLSLQNGNHPTLALPERGNSTSPTEGLEEKGASMPECSNGARSHNMANLIEDRKDIRHKELMALEREKLAVFREASITISNALTSAVAMFSKVAEELLLSHQ
ncbi:hypothetical protein L7F22_000398 [Adiantum nelumboides]|nr:hypothetical protein [Adiantum nelumboides]